MSLIFGKVVKYFENGYGFIQPLNNQSNFTKNEIFFHIRKLKQFKVELEKFRLDNTKIIYLWFKTAQGTKGEELSEAWVKPEDIPSDCKSNFLTEYADNLIKKQIPVKSTELPNKLTAFRPAIINLTSIEPSSESIQSSCEKYRLNPIGIRNDKAMRHVCLECGTDNTEFKKLERDQYKPVSSFIPTRFSTSAEGFHRCCKCGNKWYINYCWSCHSGRVDDRDPKTPRCSECSWCKCDKCSSCSYYGCNTNEYSKDNKYVDNVEIKF